MRKYYWYEGNCAVYTEREIENFKGMPTKRHISDDAKLIGKCRNRTEAYIKMLSLRRGY